MPLTRFSKWTILYGVIAAEVAVMTGAYYVWHYMNTSQCKHILHGWTDQIDY